MHEVINVSLLIRNNRNVCHYIMLPLILCYIVIPNPKVSHFLCFAGAKVNGVAGQTHLHTNVR